MNINKPLVSIIVPCYNAQKYIINTLLSVKNQTYQNWECLVINDGSTDNSLQHIQEFTKKNEKFSFLSQENKGLSTTRNTGIEKSKGDYLFFLDSDDIMAENCLELLVKELSNDNWDIIVGKTSAMKNNTIQHILDHPKIKNWKINNRLDALKYAIENSLIPVAQNRLYKNCFLKETNLKFQKNLLHEDELWFFETNFYAKKICYIDNITYEYKTDNPDSIINNIKDKNVLDILKIINLIYNNYYTDSNVNKDRNIVGYYILYLIKNLINRLIECETKLSKEAINEILFNLKKLNIELNLRHFNFIVYVYYSYIFKLKNNSFEHIKLNYIIFPVNSLKKTLKILKYNLIN